MRGKNLAVVAKTALTIVTVSLLCVSALAGSREKVVHDFNDKGNGGAVPFGELILGADGNFYGTASGWGAEGGGTAYELLPQKDGDLAEQVIFSFNDQQDSKTGNNLEAGLVSGRDGSLYGTTVQGGTFGYGTAFKLTPKAGGGWTEEILHSFNFDSTGAQPVSTLLVDHAGDLFGMAATGGNFNSACPNVGCGLVFELIPGTDGKWTYKVLHKFSGPDGQNPASNLISDAAGNLYGTTFGGGASNNGTVFELALKAGVWSEKVLHSFTGPDGAGPSTSVIFDSHGNIYGSTLTGGKQQCNMEGMAGCGTIFELMPKKGGWTEKVLHNFALNGKDGFFPTSGVILDAAGNLYGTTPSNDYLALCDNPGAVGCGVVFELIPNANGTWTEKILHSFTGPDGANPNGRLTFDKARNLYYGLTANGGAYNDGTVFSIAP